MTSELPLQACPIPEGLNGTLGGELEGNTLRLETDKPLEAIAQLGKTGAEITQLRVERPDLERVFLNLTGRSLRD